MAHPKANQTSFQPGNKLGTGGLTKEARAERELVNTLLLTHEHDEVWLTAYMSAIRDCVPPILLDYTYRRLGKPPETVNVTQTDTLVEMLRSVSPEKRLSLIDTLAVVEPK